MTFAICSLDQAVMEHVEELLEASGITEPPVHSLDVANHLGFPVLVDRNQPTRGSCNGALAVVYVREGLHPKHQEFLIAHEIGELTMSTIERRSGEEIDDGHLAEVMANRFACQLMVPHRWFVDDYWRTGGDLETLQGIYSTAPLNVIKVAIGALLAIEGEPFERAA
ncbi:hypothetical protein Pan216_16060 [Planctomycetes bacterium Pan216]|uniref:Uncharacterized protein n=1 Tax=Kolteria novifilia TaxID=2527975 RepID=A0A518B1A3_9BACT|nr:hypothetical protein Pan216_16060 [Planctomycetes bacterium Pan216]